MPAFRNLHRSWMAASTPRRRSSFIKWRQARQRLDYDALIDMVSSRAEKRFDFCKACTELMSFTCTDADVVRCVLFCEPCGRFLSIRKETLLDFIEFKLQYKKAKIGKQFCTKCIDDMARTSSYSLGAIILRDCGLCKKCGKYLRAKKIIK